VDTVWNGTLFQRLSQHGGADHEPLATSRRSPVSHQGPWTVKTRQMVELVGKYGAKKWSLISEPFAGPHVRKQCQEHWHNHLRPFPGGLEGGRDRTNYAVSRDDWGRWAEIANSCPEGYVLLFGVFIYLFLLVLFRFVSVRRLSCHYVRSNIRTNHATTVLSLFLTL
jgi:hypothetical protein